MRDYCPNIYIVPKGKVFYCNQEKNLKVIFEWSASGFTSIATSTANVVITGIPPSKGKLVSEYFTSSDRIDN